jgi:hypothetical protein
MYIFLSVYKKSCVSEVPHTNLCHARCKNANFKKKSTQNHRIILSIHKIPDHYEKIMVFNKSTRSFLVVFAQFMSF